MSQVVEDMIKNFADNRFLAHQVLFKHRHSCETPAFHEDLINCWHSYTPRLVCPWPFAKVASRRWRRRR